MAGVEEGEVSIEGVAIGALIGWIGAEKSPEEQAKARAFRESEERIGSLFQNVSIDTKGVARRVEAPPAIFIRDPVTGIVTRVEPVELLDEVVDLEPRLVMGGVEALAESLDEIMDLIASPSDLPLDLLEKLAERLLNPVFVPGEPCLAPAPLLRDLLDWALGGLQGGLGAIFGKVKQTAVDLLTPAFAVGEDLERFIQSILDDPITAALNLVLGHRAQIECPADASLAVGTGVIEAGIERIEEWIAGAIS